MATEPIYTSPGLAAMAPRAQTIALEWFELGYLDGWRAGYAAAELDSERAWAEVARSVRSWAGVPPFDVLCDRRGEPERAARQRQILVERAI